MLSFIFQNLATIIVLLAVILVVGLVVIKMIKDKKAGKKSCSCGCSGCPMKDSCHSDNK
ncbi:MAG: FeoB-associated Cys-rich membrane protein [Ruminococcus sp.]|nr:FeoB-associated Cys-rich membrane protein [Ruminococcus sp.]MBQ7133451.1 FeoB-associated Cys-rich membrane protein [Ruminococcus sp.]